MTTNNTTDLFSAEEFVENLKAEGSKTLVANTSFSGRDELPPYYDESLFKRGQLFYRKHRWAITFSKLYGLLSLLSDPTAIKMLEMTKRSSEPKTAYRRYVETILHVLVWYEDDFRPGSRLWKSIKHVNLQHVAVTKRACNSGLGGISQYLLAGTQFGFMGYILIRPKEAGIHDASQEELEAFAHFWRVIGYCVGVEDRFNLCRESLEETKRVCEVLVVSALRPLLLLKDPHALHMQFTFVKAFSHVIPNLSGRAWLNFLYNLAGLPDDREIKGAGVYFKLTPWQQFNLQTYIYLLSMLRYNWVRILSNFFLRWVLWMVEFYPIFARRKFGDEYADVKILKNYGRS